MKIFILGASGFLGTKLRSMLSKENEIIGIDRNPNYEGGLKLDALDFEPLRKKIIEEKAEVIISTIALTSSLECERNPELAKKLNYETASNMIKIAKELDIPAVFMSSTYIFDGKGGNYSEKDTPNPLNEYGKTKVMAEKEILSYKKGIVLRIDLMYGYNKREKGNGVFDRILSGKDIEIGDPNQMRQPIFVEDVVNFINFLLKKKEYGLFNIAGPDKLKMIDVLKNLESVVRKESKIKIVDKKSEVFHPKNATFNIEKMKSLGFKTKNMKSALKILKSQL